MLAKRILILAQVNNMSSKELDELRVAFAKDKVAMKWLKTSLFRHALRGTSFETLKPAVNGPILAIHSDEEPGLVGPSITSTAKDKKLLILAGKIENRVWTHEGCADVLDNIKSQLVLQKQLLSLLAQPSARLSSILQLTSSSLCGTLSQRSEPSNV